MSGVDERTEVVRRPIETRRRKRKHTVVSPAEAAGELGDRHHFSTIVIPVRASSGSFVAALAQVPSGVNVPTCISEITCPASRRRRRSPISSVAPGSTTSRPQTVRRVDTATRDRAAGRHPPDTSSACLARHRRRTQHDTHPAPFQPKLLWLAVPLDHEGDTFGAGAHTRKCTPLPRLRFRSDGETSRLRNSSVTF